MRVTIILTLFFSQVNFRKINLCSQSTKRPIHIEAAVDGVLLENEKNSSK